MTSSYRVIRYQEQKAGSKGVAAGMWAVEQITTKIVGFADDETQADAILRAFERADQRAEQ